MKILIKFPTRGRRERFLKVIRLYMDYKVLPETQILVTLDGIDATMNTPDMIAMFQRDGILYDIGHSTSKVHACNRGMEGREFDIVVLASDDMIPQVHGYDQIIRDEMLKHFPDTDGCLHFNDGYTHERLQTMVIFGRKYYDRFGYLYNPEYKSLWCDDEQMQVAQMLGKYVYNPMILFKHEHYANNKAVKFDSRYRITEAFYMEDKRTFDRRKENNFDLPKIKL